MAKSATKATRRVIASMSNKGGVGKTVTSKALGLLYRERGKSVAIYDGDGLVGGLLPALGDRNENSGLTRSQNPVTGCGYYDFRDDEKAATFLNVIDEMPEQGMFLHDLPGGSLRQFSRITDTEDGEVSGLLDMLDRYGVRMTVLMTLSHLLPATESVGTICGVFGDRVDYVAVVNRMWGKPEDFVFWNDESRRERATFLELGGVEIELPAIPGGAFAKSEAYHIPYNNALDRSELKLNERGQLQAFWKKFVENVQPAAGPLGL